MIYAQAEDDFNRVESNYLTALGRTAEAEDLPTPIVPGGMSSKTPSPVTAFIRTWLCPATHHNLFSEIVRE
jgi:hypothetical protein